MLVALYKINEYNEMNYYYIHNYQGHLFSPHTFTVIWGKNRKKGREKSFTFDSAKVMQKKMRSLFQKKIEEGYKLLYSYPQKNQYNEMFTGIKKQLVS
ncbi:MAG: WGR domain-containing protein [Spirochaetales bacterium]|nr:WGR domain-containing protein [Spirochaetales bacterium]